MKNSTSTLLKVAAWVLLALIVFALFRWLFGLGLPDAAFQFAAGATLIVMAGLLSGWYLSKMWGRAEPKRIGPIMARLAAAMVLCLLLIGIFVSRMIEHTQFSYFFFSVTALLVANACAAAIVNLVRMRIRSAREALAQSKTELQVLQAQLSPHFLFNTLNNLYGLSLSDHEKVPGLLLKLSDLLRYSVYEVKETFVPLANEVNYLNNYMEFEKIRLGDRLTLTANLAGANAAAVMIAPMLLIVFVENAFKHSRDTDNDRIFIDLTLSAGPATISFSIRNSYVPKQTAAAANRSGFGLESVKRRLQLLYPGRHELHINASEQEYSVTLLLRLP